MSGNDDYDVYLLDPTKGYFVQNQALSDILSGLDHKEIDNKKKEIRTSAKTGCCIITETTYTIVQNQPVIKEENEYCLKSDGTRNNVDPHGFCPEDDSAEK